MAEHKDRELATQLTLDDEQDNEEAEEPMEIEEPNYEDLASMEDTFKEMEIGEMNQDAGPSG